MANATVPVVEIVHGSAAKRKWEDHDAVPHAVDEELHLGKRLKPHDDANITPDPKNGVNERREATVDPSRISDIIESQFSLDILMKHNELRLINQELSKCQVALEQLRRCHLIPYPTSVPTPEQMLNITNGTGPAVGHKDKVPQWAPPFGVVDGPYSRHYAKWLIPDPSFDGEQFEWQRTFEGSRAGKTVPEGRATRNSFAEGTGFASKSRSHRGSAGQKLQALSSGYPQAKEKNGPCTLKRGDGQLVKLVCLDCNRENFSSTQGFINHCRIAHRRDFKSHEEAAVASGVAIEEDQIISSVPDEKSPIVANGLVHPLISSAPPDKESYRALLAAIETSKRQFAEGNLPGVTAIPTSTTSTPARPLATPSRTFVPSSSTPHLSELMRLNGFGGDLNEIVGEAKKRVNFDEVSSHDEDSDDEIDVPPHLGGLDGAADSPLPPMRVPARAGVSPGPLGRPTSSKGLDGRNARVPGLSAISPRLSMATPVLNPAGHSKIPNRLVDTHHAHSLNTHREVDMDTEMIDAPSMIDLSPNTVASNNAPSLVSDDSEYDDDNDAKSASSDGEDEDSDVAEINIEDDSDKMVPRTVLRNRSGSGGDPLRLRKEDKHVTFVSPVKEAGRDKRNRKT